MDELIKKLCAYDAWADRVVCEALTTVPAQNAGVARLVGHLMGAKEIWLQRIGGGAGPATERFPSVEISEAVGRLKIADAEMLRLASGDNLEAVIAYRDTKGDPHQEPLRDILIHLVNHSTYHRGQLATAIKAAGGEPAGSDYILWVRMVGSRDAELRR